LDARRQPDRALAEELRGAVVFSARFEFFTQQFLLPNGATLHGATLGEHDEETLELEQATPLPNPERVAEYWADVLPPGTARHDYPREWCGALCLFAIHRAELGADVFWRRGFCEQHLRRLPPLELPQPGDVAYFIRYQHHAIVESVDQERGTFDSIDGNQAPGIRRRRARKLSAAAAFYSLEPLIERKEAHGAG
jgi:hypothetical protein